MSKKLSKLNGKRLRPGHPSYDAEAQKLLDAKVAEAKKWHQTSDEANWREGRALRFIRDNKLFIQDGYPNMSQWVAAKLGRRQTTGYRRMWLADSFGLNEVKHYTVAKINAARSYVAATSKRGTDWTPKSLEINVPDEHGRLTAVPFEKATTDEILAARDHHVMLSKSHRESSLPEPIRRLVAQVEDALRIDEERTLATVRVTPSADGNPENTSVIFEVRPGDVHAMASRLNAVLEPRRARR